MNDISVDVSSAPSPHDRLPALEMEAVRKVYGSGENEVVALDNVTLTLANDEIIALVGPSGSGKTTLCSIAGGILSPTSGRIVVGGRDISHYGAKQLTEFRRDEIGFVFQSVNLVPFLTARENLLVVDEIGRRTGAKAWRAPTSSSTSSGSPTAPGISRPSSRGASASGSQSDAR